MNWKTNSRKNDFLNSFPPNSLEDVKLEISGICRFNFKYLDVNQKYASDLTELDKSILLELFDKLKWFSKQTLSHWQQEKVGAGKHHILEIYGAFPKRSKFEHPLHVPSDVDWARFRLDGKKRLIGFTIPKGYCDSNSYFKNNTFYIVFIDLNHNFYKTQK